MYKAQPLSIESQGCGMIQRALYHPYVSIIRYIYMKYNS